MGEIENRYASQAEAARPLASIIITNFNVDDGSTDDSREVIGRFAGRITAVLKGNGGQASGPPPNDKEAIRRLEDLRRSGANFLAFAWPAFWWHDYYSSFHKQLRSTYQRTVEGDDPVLFDISERREDAARGQ